MIAERPWSRLKPLITLLIAEERDIVTARQRSRQLAERLGFGAQNQARIATGVSEISRNAWQYAGGGKATLAVDLDSRPQTLWIEISDRGRGIPDPAAILNGRWHSPTGMGVGISGTRQLMDEFDVQTKTGEGTIVRFAKHLPSSAPELTTKDLQLAARSLAEAIVPAPLAEFRRQDHDLLEVLDVLNAREADLEQRQRELERLNVELQETNRGVVALYAELDERASALRRADEMRSRFFSHMSHEFRTPVSSILALTQLLLRRVDGDLSAEQERQVNYIRQSGRDLNEMINEILDFAKAEAGKIEVRRAPVQIAPVFGAVRAIMKPLVSSEAVALIFEDPPPDLWIETDETRLSQILRNLISNALKFTEHGEVRVRVLPPDANTRQDSPDDQWIRISVRDTGIGVPPEHIDKIFEEFSQVENRLQRHVRGTGLGLPLSRRLAELLGGALTVTSAPGLGSEFVITLPGPAHSPEMDRSHPLESLHEPSVLVVDDDEPTRYLTAQLFRGSNVRLILCADSLEAAERARFENPALILLDLNMPGKNGYEVMDQLSSDPSTRRIPVVIHTSKKPEPADMERFGDRASAIMSKKPGERREALLRIRQILHNETLFADQPEFSGDLS